METKNIVILASGTGTTLQAIINAINSKVLNAKIIGIVSDKEDSGALQIAVTHDLPSACLVYDANNQTREQYDDNLAEYVREYHPDLIILAGWMRILTKNFINQFLNVINLHPALPNTFPGHRAISDALKAYKENKITYTGAMVHHVIEEIDAGKVVQEVKVPIYDTDNEETLKARIQYFEKPLLIQAIQKTLDKEAKPESKYPFQGKVRDIYEPNSENHQLCIVHSNRLSAFDRHICDVPYKGTVLNLLSQYWFNITKNIVPNHFLYAKENTMITKKCTPFQVEVVVRGYITGNTKTSLWTHYNNGAREYCGIPFPDCLRKNQKIDTVITPTTKGEIDEPISAEEIVERGLMTQKEWDYVSYVALKLFKFGQKHAEARGFILVDTKYEFGKDVEGNILLIDELHTCDSSRFWVKESYKKKMVMNQEPEKLDKDRIRDYIKADTSLDPYDKTKEWVFPRRNNEMASNDIAQIYQVSEVYKQFYEKLTFTELPTMSIKDNYQLIYSEYLEEVEPTAVIIAGSISDEDHVKKLESELHKKHIKYESYYSSAHKNTKVVLDLIEKYDKKSKKVVWITVAGRSNALSGVVAANSRNPVIGCPPFKDKTDMIVNINSTLQCPSNVPVLTTLEPNNVANAIKRIFAL
jgi:formyltetrahydrofolate-dependent phosphoribosylglycinamide formyltransferase/phosphoribosylaminoimidazole-succinocarboxamide synthase